MWDNLRGTLGMSGTTPPVESLACQRLREADTAFHNLSSGQSVREVIDEDGSKVAYATANRAGLLSYIRTLQPLCETYSALALAGLTRPTKFLF